MATTSNYSWTTPDDTDLVKDGASAIRTLGSAIDTTVFNNAGAAVAKSLIDAEGDLIVGDAADAVQRLAIGSNGNVLTVDTTVDGKIKWAAASSGLTLIKTASYSGVADTGTTFDDVFSSTYTNYLLVCDFQAVTNTADMLFQYRYAGPTTQATLYAAYRDLIAGQTSPTSTISFQNGTTSVILNDTTGSSSYPTYGTIEVFNIGTSTRPVHSWNFYGDNNQEWASGGGAQGTARTYTGFILSATTGNISGTVSVYGLAK